MDPAEDIFLVDILFVFSSTKRSCYLLRHDCDGRGKGKESEHRL